MRPRLARRRRQGAAARGVPVQWLLVLPFQSSPQAQVQRQTYRLSGADPLAVRAREKLRSEDLSATSFGCGWSCDAAWSLTWVSSRNFHPLRSLAVRLWLAPLSLKPR
jgi:hypothetical protein